MTEMANYPTHNVPPSGLNPGFYPNPAERGSSVMYPPSAGPGYPPPGAYPPAGDGYPPPGYPVAGAYPPVQGGYPAPMTNPPVSGAGYPPPGNYPQPGMQPPLAQGNWMPAPVGVPLCPPGLEYLSVIDQLIVHQKIELLEVITGFETKNEYLIKNSMGQMIYTAKEDTDCCTRGCCGPSRPFDMNITDNAGNEIIHLYRPLRCMCCCSPCCLQELEVMAPPGTVIGSIVQEWTILYPNFRVQNAAGETVLRIEGPCCGSSCCADVDFKVLSKDGKTEVGCIRKQWSGFVREAYTDADNFGITFPMDLDVNLKAVLLGACMLIDFMYFERNNSRRR